MERVQKILASREEVNFKWFCGENTRKLFLGSSGANTFLSDVHTYERMLLDHDDLLHDNRGERTLQRLQFPWKGQLEDGRWDRRH